MSDKTINEQFEGDEGALPVDPLPLEGKTIALLATNGFEDSELTKPLEALHGAGAEVDIISETLEDIEGKNGTEAIVDKSVNDVSADDYDGLFLPGGVVNPDTLRLNAAAVSFVREFNTQKKPIAAICHAPWL